MPQANDFLVDKRRMRLAFERAAPGYDAAAVLQREVADRSLERLDVIRAVPVRILDLGAGTGYCTRALARRYPKARIIAIDIAHAMLRRARAQISWWQRLRRRYSYLCGDAEALPLADASVDMIFSNLTLQWCTDLDRVFGEFRRVLVPGGLLLFTTFGPDTLKELRAAWGIADAAGTHVGTFIDMHDIGDALVRAQFATPVMDMEYLTVTYRDAYTLMRDLKQIGAHNVTSGRQRGLTGRVRLRTMLAAYETYRCEGVLPATHEVVYGHAWAPEKTVPNAPHGADATISLDALRANLRR